MTPASVPSTARRRAVVGAVAIGGALGALARWSLTELADPRPGAFPWHTLVVNVVGSVLIGAAASRLDRARLSWAFTVTGLLGGFTTFSTFAVEVDRLIALDRTASAVGYVAASLGAGLLGHAVALRTMPRPPVAA